MENIEKEDWRRKCERYVNHVQSQHEDMHSSPNLHRTRPTQAFTTRDGGGTCHHEIRSAFLLSSAHGLPFAARAKNPCTKALWITIFLGVCGCLAYFLYLLVLRYMHFGFTSMRHFKAPLLPDTFPSVTVCNANALKRTKVENSRFRTTLGKHTGEFLYNNATKSDMPMIDVTEYAPLLTLLNQNGITETVNFLNQMDRLQDVRKVSLPSKEDLYRIYADTHDMELVWWTMELEESEVEALGHTHNETIVLCHFNGRRCNTRSQYSTTHDINFGNCFTWRRDRSIEYSIDSGLELTFDLNVKEYLGLFSDEVGLRVFIHQSQTNFQDSPVYSATPGMMTSFAITEHHHIRPAGNCSQTPMATCVSNAIAARTEKVCGCSLPGRRRGSLSTCKTSSRFQYVCSEAVRTLYASGTLQTDCKAECREIIYEVETSQKLWPSPEGLVFTRGELKRTRGLDISSDFWENIGRLRISYADHFLRVHEEHDEFLIFLTHVGGATALVLGLSAMTLIELIYIFFEAIWWAVTSCRRRPKATRIEYLRPSAGESVVSSFGQRMKRPPSSKHDSANVNWKLQPRANVYLPAIDPEDIKIYDTATSTLYRQAWDDANARFSDTAQLPNIPNSIHTSHNPGNSNDVTWYYRKPQDEVELRKTAKMISELAADKKNLLDANKKVYF